MFSNNFNMSLAIFSDLWASCLHRANLTKPHGYSKMRLPSEINKKKLVKVQKLASFNDSVHCLANATDSSIFSHRRFLK